MSSGLRNAAMNGPTTPPRGPAASSATAAFCAALSSCAASGGIRSGSRAGARPRERAARGDLRFCADLRLKTFRPYGTSSILPAVRRASSSRCAVAELGERQHAVDPRPQRAGREPREQVVARASSSSRVAMYWFRPGRVRNSEPFAPSTAGSNGAHRAAREAEQREHRRAAAGSSGSCSNVSLPTES